MNKITVLRNDYVNDFWQKHNMDTRLNGQDVPLSASACEIMEFSVNQMSVEITDEEMEPAPNMYYLDSRADSYHAYQEGWYDCWKYIKSRINPQQ